MPSFPSFYPGGWSPAWSKETTLAWRFQEVDSPSWAKDQGFLARKKGALQSRSRPRQMWNVGRNEGPSLESMSSGASTSSLRPEENKFYHYWKRCYDRLSALDLTTLVLVCMLWSHPGYQIQESVRDLGAFEASWRQSRCSDSLLHLLVEWTGRRFYLCNGEVFLCLCEIAKLTPDSHWKEGSRWED